MEVKGKTEAGLTASDKNHSQIKPVFTIILFSFLCFLALIIYTGQRKFCFNLKTIFTSNVDTPDADTLLGSIYSLIMRCTEVA